MDNTEDRQYQFASDGIELGVQYAHIMFKEHAADEEWLESVLNEETVEVNQKTWWLLEAHGLLESFRAKWGRKPDENDIITGHDEAFFMMLPDVRDALSELRRIYDPYDNGNDLYDPDMIVRVRMAYRKEQLLESKKNHISLSCFIGQENAERWLKECTDYGALTRVASGLPVTYLPESMRKELDNPELAQPELILSDGCVIDMEAFMEGLNQGLNWLRSVACRMLFDLAQSHNG